MERETLVRAVEAILFASPEPLSLARLEEVFAPGGADRESLTDALGTLGDELTGRGVELREVAGGWQLRTAPDLGLWLARLEVPRPVRFSRAALEVLALVAYRQPATRAEVEEVRGVDCGGVLKVLLDRGLVRIVGKKDVPGRPLLYGTSRKFLEVFGLAGLGELPSLRDLDEILAARAEPDAADPVTPGHEEDGDGQ